MTDRLILIARRPPDAMWNVLCDRICELRPLLDSIVAAEILASDTEQHGIARRSHRWLARANVPAILAPHIQTDHLSWICRTEWHREQYRSRWIIEPGFLDESQNCEATLAFHPALGGKGTRIHLDLDVTRVEMPGPLRGLTLRILGTHFRLLVEAAEKFLDEESSDANGRVV
jgi:hypothetical protein